MGKSIPFILGGIQKIVFQIIKPATIFRKATADWKFRKEGPSIP